jgi:hypothetical protein
MRRFLPFCGGEGDQLHIDTGEVTEAMVAHVSGEVDLGRLKAALEPALSNCRNMILDVRDLRYTCAISSSRGCCLYRTLPKILPCTTARSRNDDDGPVAPEYKHLDVNQSSSPIAQTLSLGVAGFLEHGSTVEEVLRAADVALYRAKRAGRDRVVVAGPVA